MGKEVGCKNRDRFIQLGIAISTLRKVRGLTQKKLAANAGVSRSLISNIEAPNMAYEFSLDVLFNTANTLNVDPADFLRASTLPNIIIKSR